MGMKVSYKSKDDGFKSMIKRLEAIDGTAVEVGVLEGEHKWLAAIHEYGLDIAVTPAMRAYLHGQGLHLKDSTTHIHIPERSFLRTGYDKNRDDVMKKAKLLLQEVSAGRMSANAFIKAIGLELSGKIKDYAVELDSPPNHPFTVDRKGTSNPLVGGGAGSGGESGPGGGDMIGGITWRKAK